MVKKISNWFLPVPASVPYWLVLSLKYQKFHKELIIFCTHSDARRFLPIDDGDNIA